MRYIYILLLLCVCAQAADPNAQKTISDQLDDFHQRASRAQGPEYFAHFAPDAIFLGTDITERWTVDEFKAYAMPFFEKGKGWTYLPQERHVTISKDGKTAWFDETLKSQNYGATRGSGVLVKLGGEWKISQYNLTVPVPNALLPEVVEMIKASELKVP